MGKQKNYGSYSLREWIGLFANPLVSKLADVFSKTPPARQAGLFQCFFWMPIGEGRVTSVERREPYLRFSLAIRAHASHPWFLMLFSKSEESIP